LNQSERQFTGTEQWNLCELNEAFKVYFGSVLHSSSAGPNISAAIEEIRQTPLSFSSEGHIIEYITSFTHILTQFCNLDPVSRTFSANVGAPLRANIYDRLLRHILGSALKYRQEAGPFSKDGAETWVDIALQTNGILRKSMPIDDGPPFKGFVMALATSYTQGYRLTTDIHNARRSAHAAYPQENHTFYFTFI
jgi:hypothetical protein